MPKSTDKLSYDEVLEIPKLINKKGWSMTAVAKHYKVSENAIRYWVKKLREKGFEIKTRKRGYVGLLDKVNPRK